MSQVHEPAAALEKFIIVPLILADALPPPPETSSTINAPLPFALKNETAGTTPPTLAAFDITKELVKFD